METILGEATFSELFCILSENQKLNYNTPPLSCNRQITLSNIDEICPLAIPNQIFLISMHVFGLVKIPWTFTHYRPETKIWICLGQTTPSKFDEICPLTILNLISTISMHIPKLVKIHCQFYVYSSYRPETKYGRMGVFTRRTL